MPMSNTRIWKTLEPLVDSRELTLDDAIAIYRCLLYSDQIADVSIGNIFRPNIEELLKED